MRFERTPRDRLEYVGDDRCVERRRHEATVDEGVHPDEQAVEFHDDPDSIAERARPLQRSRNEFRVA